MKQTTPLCGVLWLITYCASATAAERVDFEKQIQPIFVKHCVECHGPDTQDGGVRWDRRRSAFRGGDSGVPSIIKEKPDDSELIKRLITDDEDERMPSDSDPLAKSEIDLIRKWIEQGAEWPDDGSDKEPVHWAYVAPVRPELPKTKNKDWIRNATDAFVLARLEAEGLKPSPQEDRAKLLRRVSLDLTGLPPTIAEVDAFLADTSPDAYEKAVDRLLASPRYGEHWARPWLDLARYADSNGYQRDGFKTMWAYRDWVVGALNKDLPFDQFTIEQIAGDMLPNATIEQRVATGFNRCPTVNVEAGSSQEENRVNQVFDRVDTTATVWLGSSIRCAQCHNHKYDPFTQREYYQLFAFFNSTPIETKTKNGKKDEAGLDFTGAPRVTVPLNSIVSNQRTELEQEYAKLERRWKARRELVVAGFPDWEKKVTAQVQAGAKWHVLKPESFKAKGGAGHKPQKDGSLLVTGPKPAKDTYIVTVKTKLSGITALRVEALRDQSLPKNGPGRRAGRANFVLTEFTVDAKDLTAGGSAKRVKLATPQASFHQQNFHAARAIDGNDATGWAIAPEFGKSHWATFHTAEPIGKGDTLLTFTLNQNHGSQRTIGRLRLSALVGDAAAVGLPDYVTRILRRKPQDRTAAEKDSLREYLVKRDPALLKMSASMAKLKADMEKAGGKGAGKSTTSLVMVELDQMRMTNLLKRGNFETKGIAVKPGVPESLHEMPKDAALNRLGFARWLVDRRNPLVARVTVNRWWAEIFGQGLVTTPEDFGTQGERPSHPQLLDWLAVEFMEKGWSTKHIHKLIVMSATYRQSSRVSAKLLAKDPTNQLLARGPRIRLAAEAIRDNALAISGLLSTKMGGPPIYPVQPAGIWTVDRSGRQHISHKQGRGSLSPRRLCDLAAQFALSELRQFRRSESLDMRCPAPAYQHATHGAHLDERPCVRRNGKGTRGAHCARSTVG